MMRIDHKSMNCAEIITAISDIIADAAIEAERITAEIDAAYTEREKAETAMHEAAARKDSAAYTASFMQHNYICEIIANREKERDILADGCILDHADAAAIRKRMYDECITATLKAAREISKHIEQMNQASRELDDVIGERNKVLLKLYDAVRPKDRYGNQTGPEYYTEGVVRPYLKDINNIRTANKAGFYVFLDHHKND